MAEAENNNTSPSRRPDLGLQIPAREAERETEYAFLLNPKEAKAWFAGLPMANVGETARQIYHALVDFNRMQVPDMTRAKIAEGFREPIDYIRNSLEKHYFNAGFPLTPKGQKASRLTLALDTELANAFKIITQDMLAADEEHFDRSLLIISLHRSLTYLTSLLYRSALIYAEWPERIWREIHTIYAYASLNHIHQMPVKNSVSDKRSSTIEELYKTSLILTTANPSQLRQSYIKWLFHHIPELIALVNVESFDEKALGPGRFYLDLGTDAPPSHMPPASAKRRSTQRIVDFNGVLKQLRQDYEDAPWESTSRIHNVGDKLPKSLLQRLIQGWSQTTERQFSRTHLNFELRVITGLYNIHRALVHYSENSQERSKASEFHTGLMPHVKHRSAKTKENVFEGLALTPFQGKSAVANEPSTESHLPDSVFANSTMLQEEEPGIGHELSCILTCNESAEGYCVTWQGERTPRISVNELIGIQSGSRPDLFALASVRWMKQLRNGELRLGLYILAHQCHAVTVRPADKSIPPANRIDTQCLLLHNNDKEQDDVTLISSAINFQVGNLFNIQYENGDTGKIRLTSLIDSNGAFAHYRFALINNASSNSSISSEYNDFNDIWDKL